MVPLRRAVRAATGAVLDTPLEAAALAGLRWAARTLPPVRPVTAVAFYAGEHLATPGRLLRGRVPRPARTPIWLLAEDRMHRHIYFYGVHEPATTRFLRSALVRGSTFVDVGANAGYFSLLAGALTVAPGSVHAFEPNPVLFGLLARSIAAQGHTAVVAVPAALGDRDGTVDLFLSTDAGNSGLSTLEPDVLGGGAARLPVEVRRLDGYCEEHGLAPGVLKVDVEGHELSVLRGARELLGRGVPRWVICELETARCPAAPLLEFMSGVGYRPRSLAEDGSLGPYEARPVQNVVFTR